MQCSVQWAWLAAEVWTSANLTFIDLAWGKTALVNSGRLLWWCISLETIADYTETFYATPGFFMPLQGQPYLVV
jgi:hypothetical protein